MLTIPTPEELQKLFYLRVLKATLGSVLNIVRFEWAQPEVFAFAELIGFIYDRLPDKTYLMNTTIRMGPVVVWGKTGKPIRNSDYDKPIVDTYPNPYRFYYLLFDPAYPCEPIDKRFQVEFASKERPVVATAKTRCDKELRNIFDADGRWHQDEDFRNKNGNIRFCSNADLTKYWTNIVDENRKKHLGVMNVE